MATYERATIGFESGQVLPVRVEPEALDRLTAALTDGGWHDLEVDDGTVRLNLAKVIYLRTERDEHRVGF
jgi:hypothetical protein